MTRIEITNSITKGAALALIDLGYAPICEFTLKIGRRADICGISDKGEIIIIEVKSSIEDFRADNKWHEYSQYCDLFYFAVGRGFPLEILPPEIGVFVCDEWGGAIIRKSCAEPLNAARRKSVTLQFARQAAFKATNQLKQFEISQA